MQIKVMWTEDYRHSRFVEFGEMPDSTQVIEANPLKLDKESRQILVEAGLAGKDSIDLTSLEKHVRGGKAVFQVSGDMDINRILKSYGEKRAEYLTQAQTEANERLQKEMTKAKEKLESGNPPTQVSIPQNSSEELTKQAKELQEEINKHLAQKRARLEAQRAEAVLQGQIAKERDRAEKASWISEHGSEHLREAFEAGYDCQRRYVTERAAVDYPGYILDFDDLAEWNSRSCPSPQALAEAKRVGGEVVWLTSPPYKHDPDPYNHYYEKDPWTFREAVLIEDYLAIQYQEHGYTRYRRYSLIKEV